MRKNFQIDTSQIEIRANFLFRRKFFRILDPQGLNFIAINLKFLRIVDNYVTYNL